MGLFSTANDDLQKRVAALEAERTGLRREWENAQLDIIELTRRASNALRSLAREARHAEVARDQRDAVPGLDPVSAAIKARRMRVLPTASSE